MLIVATFGLLANLISVIILHDNKESSLNIQAAYLHLMGDTLSSVAVIIGGYSHLEIRSLLGRSLDYNICRHLHYISYLGSSQRNCRYFDADHT